MPHLSSFIRAATLLPLWLAGMHAYASSSQSWSDHNRQVVAGCVKASGFKQARVVSQPVEFDDRVGYSALLIEGTYPQAHMKGRRGQALCLFDKLSHDVYVSELTPHQGKAR
ncbi:hypothetical protein [Chitinimonas naiadis]